MYVDDSRARCHDDKSDDNDRSMRYETMFYRLCSSSVII